MSASNRTEFETLDPAVAAKIASWRPRGIDPQDTAVLDAVLPAVRACVAAVRPATPKAAVNLLNPTTRMALWWHERFGNVDAAAMLTPPNIDHFANVVDAARTPAPTGRRSVRSKLRRVARAVNPSQWLLREDGMNCAELESLDPEVAARITTWLPGKIDPQDVAALNVVLPEVRSWVAAVLPPPRTADTAENLLRAATQMALWWHKDHESLDVVAMMTPPNIEHFMKVVNADRPLLWQRSTRSSLRRIGRTFNPDHHWPYRLEGSEGHPYDHASEDGHPISWCPSGLDIDSLRAKFDALAPAVQKSIASWTPRIDDPEDVEAFDVVLPLVRACVTAVEPVSASAVLSLRIAIGRLALWWHEAYGRIDTKLMLAPHNVEYFTMFECTNLSPSVQDSMRGCLRRIGRVVNPHDWPLEAPKVPVRDAVPPYTAAEEAMYCRAAMRPGRVNRAARLWVVVATFGAGLTGVEAGRTMPDDLVERADGRIVVNVRDRDAKTRIVPVRSAYTDVAREAIRASDGKTFFRGTGVDRARAIAERLPDDRRISGSKNVLSLWRARHTWLVAHLTANTPLAALYAVAGPLSTKTLATMIRHADADMSAAEAVELALEA